MKKTFITLLATLLSAFASNAMADTTTPTTVSINFKETTISGFLVGTTGTQSAAGNLDTHIRVSISTKTNGKICQSSSNGIYFLDTSTDADSRITITATNAKITNVKYTFGGKNYAPTTSGNGYDATNSTKGITLGSDTPPTAEFSSTAGVTSVVMKFGAQTTKQKYAIRLTNLEITYLATETEKTYTDFVDQTEYTATAGKVDNINYKRTFYGCWQTLFVPFALDVTDDALSDYRIAKIKQVDEEHGYIYADIMTSGSTEANYPYLIKCNNVSNTEDGEEKEIKLDDTELVAASYVKDANIYPINLTTSDNTYTIAGSYSKKTDMEGIYSLNNGVLQPGSASATLPAQRWYMTVAGNSYSAKMFKIHIIGEEYDDDTTTGIYSFESNENNDNSACYNLAGQRINANTKGFVIKNGKKYFNK